MIKGTIILREANAGSKSAGVYPYLMLETGELVKIRKLNANPFEKNVLNDYENKKVVLEGEFNDNETFMVTEIAELEEENALDSPIEGEEETELPEEECPDCNCEETEDTTCPQESCDCNCSENND